VTIAPIDNPDASPPAKSAASFGRNTGAGPLKLYTLYAPPEHVEGTVHATKAEAEVADEHFDGQTSE
jgi:hypothetical protein